MSAALTVLSLFALSAAGPAAPAGDGKVLVLERTVTVYGLPPRPDRTGEEGAGEKAAPADASKPAVVKLRERNVTVRIAADRLRENWPDDGRATVVRFDLGLVWTLDPADKTYREISFREIERLSADARDRLVRRLPLIEDRALQARLRSLLGERGKPPELSVEQGGDVRKIAGEPCRALTVRLGGEELFRGQLSAREVPLADGRWLQLGGCFPREVAEKLAALRGVLMEATFPMPDGGRLELVTRSVAEARAEPGEFDDPKGQGYKPASGRRAAEPAKSDKPDQSDTPDKPDKAPEPARPGKQP